MKTVKLPPIEELKELIKDGNNLTFYKRVKWEGPIESVNYLKRKIKEYNAFLEDSKEEDTGKIPPKGVGL